MPIKTTARELSTGDPATLGSYLKLCTAVFGEDHPSVEFLKMKIADSPHGLDEGVLADESQMIYAMFHMTREHIAATRKKETGFAD